MGFCSTAFRHRRGSSDPSVLPPNPRQEDQIMIKPQIDYAAMAEKWRAEREAANKVARTELLTELRGLGVIQVTAKYEGYGDSGNVEDITLQPVGIELPSDISTRLEEFAWSVAYHQHPGFENNEGGYGTLTWDVSANSMTLDHADRYVECSHSYDEGL
jgi:uncharacterized protein DUF6878